MRISTGHFLLTKLLLKKMIETAKETGVQGRIVNVSSSIHGWFSGDSVQYLRLITKDKRWIFIHISVAIAFEKQGKVYYVTFIGLCTELNALLVQDNIGFFVSRIHYFFENEITFYVFISVLNYSPIKRTILCTNISCFGRSTNDHISTGVMQVTVISHKS